jgi:hypothetical protein
MSLNFNHPSTHKTKTDSSECWETRNPAETISIVSETETWN